MATAFWLHKLACERRSGTAVPCLYTLTGLACAGELVKEANAHHRGCRCGEILDHSGISRTDVLPCASTSTVADLIPFVITKEEQPFGTPFSSKVTDPTIDTPGGTITCSIV